MTSKLNDALIADYPQLFCSENETDPRRRCVRCQCGPGWHDIIRLVSELIAARMQNHHPAGEFKWLQIKEKFGVLRMYYQGPSDDFISGAVKMAEFASSCICDECGAPGILRKLGWWRTLCDKCDANRHAPE